MKTLNLYKVSYKKKDSFFSKTITKFIAAEIITDLCEKYEDKPRLKIRLVKSISIFKKHKH
jgi:hypothetical protein